MEGDDFNTCRFRNVCKIKLSHKIDQKTPAFLVDFSNSHLKINHDQDIKFESYKSVSENEEPNRILVANNGHLEYAATNSKFNPNSSLRYMIGVRNKSTGKMKMYDSLFFHLKPVNSTPIVNKNNIVNMNYQENMDSLTDIFGSKVKKRALVSRVKYAAKAKDIESISEAIKDLPQQEVEQSENDDQYDYLPQKNNKATTPSDVYFINDLISEKEIEVVEEDAKLLRNASPETIEVWKNTDKYCKYVIDHIKNEKVNMTKAKFLIYYNYLTIFNKLKYADIRKRDPAPSMPQPLKYNLLERFTALSKFKYGLVNRALPNRMKDKLLAHLILIALFIDGFKTNLSLVQSDLKVGMPKLVSLSQILGCHITSKKIGQTVIKYAELKLPLFVPTPKLHSHLKRKL